MQAGRLRERITFKSLTTTEVTGWDDTPSWVEAFKVWADVVATGGAERVRLQGVLSETQYVIKIRYRTDVTDEMQIVWGDKTLDILSVFPADGKKEYLIIQAKKHG